MNYIPSRREIAQQQRRARERAAREQALEMQTPPRIRKLKKKDNLLPIQETNNISQIQSYPLSSVPTSFTPISFISTSFTSTSFTPTSFTPITSFTLNQTEITQQQDQTT
ncbi:hypothetical protein Glove_341g43 [Diversispora epigaea]|uniref:Uncharacterized protein n=1 Tax=Diversispora epigaea TaxID=1348612 RepID=A0A397HGP2_9GLOM|nr:hypothetical protein Glove_341g43 [Diversispora epigaea]